MDSHAYAEVVTTIEQPDHFGRIAPRHVAGDRADIDRWVDATYAYLSVLKAVEEEVLAHWREHGHQLPLGRRKRRSFQDWQAVVEAAYQRVVAASDQYRPAFDDVTVLTANSQAAYDKLAELFRSLFEWGQRRIWNLRRQGDVYLITRTDMPGEGPDETTPGSSIGRVYAAAYKKRYGELRAVDWDENAITASDAELAELSEAHEVVRTRSGEPLTTSPSMSFADWFSLHNGEIAWYGGTVPRDFRSISDRDRLAEDIEDRARYEAGRKRRRRTTSTRGGSWPTDGSPVDPTDGGSPDHSGGDYGGSFGGGGDGGGGGGGGI